MKSNSFKVKNLEPKSYHGFSDFDLCYWTTPHILEDALNTQTSFIHIKDKILHRKDFAFRAQICNILTAQYSSLQEDPVTKSQIAKLGNDNCYTVICAHQPVLFGGPAYWIYKIASTISLAQRLKAQFPELEFVPVYFCGSEDHDFEEISSVRFFSKSFKWTENSGVAVGRLPTNNILPVIDALKDVFKNDPNALRFFETQNEHLKNSPDYKSYFRAFTHELFGKYGLLHFDPDDPEAKKIFKPIIEKELKEEFIFKNSEENAQIISKLGFTPQVNARPVNLFFHHPTSRQRILRTNENEYTLADSNVRWTQTEILDHLHQSPQDFSPNVLLRPLYQEYLFPNIAFIGGGAEIAYWLQLTGAFKSAKIPYPALIRRLSAIHIDHKLRQKIDKSNFEIEDFLKPEHLLEKAYLNSITDEKPIADSSFHEIIRSIDKLRNQFSSFDEPSKISMEAEIQKALKSLEHIQQKQLRFLKNKHESELRTLKSIREQLLPDNNLQERVINQLPVYFKYKNSYLDLLMECYNPELAVISAILEES